MRLWITYLRDGTVSERISMMRETVPDKTQFALFYVLLDGIVWLIFGNFLLSIGPTRDFDNHVEDLGTCTGR
jgi:hypothetical protein